MVLGLSSYLSARDRLVTSHVSYHTVSHPKSQVGSAHTRLAIGLRTFGQSTRAWGQLAACAEARPTEGAPRLRGSRLAKGEARRAAWRYGAVRPAPHWWAVPTPGSRLGCAPSVRVRARGASLRLARRHSSRRASRACGGHASQRARRDAEHGDAGRFAPRPTGWKCRLRMCRSSSMPHDISMKERLPVRPGEESPAARRPGPGAEADPQADTSAAWASRGRRWGSARSPRPGRAWRWDCASA